MTAKTQKSKTAYWAVTSKIGTVYEGTHTQCWQVLVNIYGDVKVKELEAQGVKITRIK